MIKKGEIARTILAGISVAGIILVGAAMPNIFQAIPRSFFKKKYPRKSLDRSLYNLKRRGYIKFTQGQRGWRIELTEKGKRELFAYEIKEKLIKCAKKWDHKWRMLIFDIEEKKRHVRDRVRRALVSFGFYRLQDSVWVYPYECEEILELLRTNYGVRYEALYLRTEYLAKDERLREHFNLK